MWYSFHFRNIVVTEEWNGIVGDEAEDQLEYHYNNPSVEWWNDGSELEEWYLQYIQEEESIGANCQL